MSIELLNNKFPLTDLHHFCLTKGFPKAPSGIQSFGTPSASCIDQNVPGKDFLEQIFRNCILQNFDANSQSTRKYNFGRQIGYISQFQTTQLVTSNLSQGNLVLVHGRRKQGRNFGPMSSVWQVMSLNKSRQETRSTCKIERMIDMN